MIWRWRDKEIITLGDTIDAIRDIAERYIAAIDNEDPWVASSPEAIQEEAVEFMDAWHVVIREANPGEDSIDILRRNIGYSARYIDDERVIQTVFDIFGTTHPYFGSTKPTPDEAFKKGLELGEERREAAKAAPPIISP
jgi:hypothetical protein